MKEKLKQELQTMVSRGVICKVGEHTNWCSSLAYSTKLTCVSVSDNTIVQLSEACTGYHFYSISSYRGLNVKVQPYHIGHT